VGLCSVGIYLEWKVEDEWVQTSLTSRISLVCLLQLQPLRHPLMTPTLLPKFSSGRQGSQVCDCHSPEKEADDFCPADVSACLVAITPRYKLPGSLSLTDDDPDHGYRACV
jgi:hypothetical protein